MSERGRELVGQLSLEPPGNFDGALVVIRLDDVSCIDAPAQNVAALEFKLWGTKLQSLPFRLVIPPHTGARRLSVSAEIHMDGSESLQPGDYRNAVAAPWQAGISDSGFVIEVVRLGMASN